jgi:hypothetical protein
MTRNEKKRLGLWNPQTSAAPGKCSRWFERKAASRELRAAKRLRGRYGESEAYTAALGKVIAMSRFYAA